uniref:Uncharacterized protein n=1 Tax=Arundo donax TaxID=35708 RepID=A0A0A9AYY8_ARUDO
MHKSVTIFFLYARQTRITIIASFQQSLTHYTS